MRDILKILTLGDKLLVALLAALSCLSFFWLDSASEPGEFVVISTADSGLIRKSLLENETLTVTGPVGRTKIAIQDGTVRVLDSDCPNKICRNRGAISGSRKIIVCVPNHVTITIQGRPGNKFDAITG